jgi:CubicO group peptidase (beta-lactamase class C family)
MFRPLLSLVLLLSSSLHAEPSAQPPTTPEALRARLNAVSGDAVLPGLGAVVVSPDGETLLLGAGLADLESGRRADADTHFRIGSISKTFLAMAILQQVERGRLRLDDEVAKLLPDIRIDNPWQATDPVRVVHLLEHTAGFDDMHFSNMARIPGQDTAAEMARFTDEFRVRWRPGERMSYSNPGYGLLGYLLEKISGREQREAITEAVLLPLGMTATLWEPDMIRASLAQGYDPDSGVATPWDDTTMPAVGALVSTPRDMAKALAYFLSDGASVPGLLSADSLARMQRTETTLVARAGLQAGYGAGTEFGQRSGWALRGHSGGIPGYWANLVYNRQAGFGYVLLANVISSPQLSTAQRDLLAYATRDLPAPSAAQAVAADPQWNGWYHVANPRNELLGGMDRLMNAGHFAADGDRYRFTHGVVPDSAEQIALAGNRLRDPEVNHANGVLTRDADGRRVMITDDNVFLQGSWWSVALPQYALTAALALLLSTLLFAPIWSLRALRGRLKHSLHWRDRIWPLAASLVLMGTVWLAFGLSITEVTSGAVTPRMLGIMLGGWLFAALAVIGAVQTLRHWQFAGNRWARIHTLLVSLAACGLALWLWRVDLLGLRLWAW